MQKHVFRAAAALAVCLAGVAPAAADSATFHVSPSGTGSACSVAAPCASFDRGYDRARPGDIVLLHGGTYRDTQVISGDKGSKTPVTVRAAPKSRVFVDGRLDVRADYVRVIGPIRVAGGVDVDDPNKSNPIQGVRISGVTAAASFIENARDLLISNSSLGGVPGKPIVMIGAWPTSYRVSFNNVRFHGNAPTDPSQHLECIFATGIRGLSIRNSRFSDCGYFGILIGHCCGAQLQPSALVLERNHFGASRCYPGAGGCGTDGKAPFSLMLGTPIEGASRIIGNHFETPPAVNASFTDLVAAENTGRVPASWRRPRK